MITDLLYLFCLRFNMLKTWIANPDLSNVDVEERYKVYAKNTRKDKYTTVGN